MKKLKRIPKFKNEEEELEFWAKHDSTEYIDWFKSRRAIFPNLQPTSKSVPIRFPISLLERLKNMAHKRHIAYQSLIKIFLFERVQKEIERRNSKK